MSTPGGKRQILGEILPLDTPLIVQIFPVYACNFRCEYCIYSIEENKRNFISDKKIMDMELYKKVINDMKIFKHRLKMLRFAGIGEPLLHPNIAEMIDIAVQADVAERVDIVTNASMLTKELADKLIKAKLSNLRISLEGLATEEYLKNSNAKINFDDMVDNIRYFYENRGKTKVYIKIIDYMLESEEKKKKFYELFDKISDSIDIEHLTPTIKEIDYSKMQATEEFNKQQNGQKIIESNICPQPFYLMQVNPDGKVVPCCSMKYPHIFYDLTSDNIVEAWNGKRYNMFRRRMLDGIDKCGDVCKDCNLYLYGMYEEDVLDEYKEELKKKYEVIM